MKIRSYFLMLLLSLFVFCDKEIDDSIIDVEIEELEERIEELEDLSSANLITGVSVGGAEIISQNISDDAVTIELASGADISNINLGFTVSENATVLQGTQGLDFSSTNIRMFTVVAQDGSTRNYAVRITVSNVQAEQPVEEPVIPGEEMDIDEENPVEEEPEPMPVFEIEGVVSVTDSFGPIDDFEAIIGQTNQIALTVPFGTDLTDLSIVFNVTEGSEIVTPITNVDFTTAANIMVSLEVDSEVVDTYLIQVEEAEIDPSLSLSNFVESVSVVGFPITVLREDIVDNCIKIELPNGTAVDALSLEFTLSPGAELEEGTVTEGLNFSIMEVKTFTVFSEAEQVMVNSVGNVYSLEITTEGSSANEVLELDLFVSETGEEIIPSSIDIGENTIEVVVPSSTPLEGISLLLELSENATSTVDITDSFDFTSPETFTVTAQDGVSEREYTITVTREIIDIQEGEAFITTWTGQEVIIPINTSAILDYDYSVDWDNDGIVDETNITGEVTHTFDTFGEHTIQIVGQFPSVNFGTFSTGDPLAIVGLEQWGTGEWLDMNRAFRDCENLIVNATDVPNFSGVRDMSLMFEGARLANPDVSDWDVSNVTNMNQLFRSAVSANLDVSDWDVSSVTTMRFMFSSAVSANPDVSLWDVSNVTNMSNMFSNADLADPDVSGWDVSSVTNMESMFSNADLANPDVSGWDVSNVTDMSSLFRSSNISNPDLSNWNIANVTDMRLMFSGITLETEVYDQILQDLSTKERQENVSFDGGNSMYCNEAARNALINDTGWVITDDGLDPDCPAILIQEGEAFITTWTGQEVIIPINEDFTYNYSVDWDNDGFIDETGITGEATHTFESEGPHTIQIIGQFPFLELRTGIFSNVRRFLIGLEQWGTGEWLSMVRSFAFCPNLVVNANDIPNLNSVTDMSGMFATTNFANPDVSLWDVSNVVNMDAIFENATLANPDVRNWDVSNVTSMLNLFTNSGIINPDLSNWNIANVTNMSGMFLGVTLETGVYDQILQDFSTKVRQDDVPFGGDSTYCNESARNALINSGWFINDGGLDPNCP